MRKVTLKDANRGGILGMPGILAVTSFPNRTSAVKRGVWVLEQVLGEHVPPAPPNVPPLEKQDKNKVANLTLRQRTELHRTNAVCAKKPAIPKRRHTHGDDDARRFSGESFLWETMAFVDQRKPWSQRLLKERFQQGWHRPQPQGKNQNDVIGPLNGVLGSDEFRRRCAGGPFCRTPQHRKIQPRDFDATDVMTLRLGATNIGVSESVTEMPCFGIRVALDHRDFDFFRHRRHVHSSQCQHEISGSRFDTAAAGVARCPITIGRTGV
jgi:hypothetical protein